MGTFGDLWGPMLSYGDLLGPMGTCWDPSGAMGTYGDLCGGSRTYGDFWERLGTYVHFWGHAANTAGAQPEIVPTERRVFAPPPPRSGDKSTGACVFARTDAKCHVVKWNFLTEQIDPCKHTTCTALVVPSNFTTPHRYPVMSAGSTLVPPQCGIMMSKISGEGAGMWGCCAWNSSKHSRSGALSLSVSLPESLTVRPLTGLPPYPGHHVCCRGGGGGKGAATSSTVDEPGAYVCLPVNPLRLKGFNCCSIGPLVPGG